MTQKSNQNAILSGYIDAFCLICESLITGDDEVERHMSLRSHKKNFESSQLVEKFKDDQILKVKKGYYCMLCNLIFTTLTKVSLHVVEKGHKSSKGSALLTRVGSLISFGDVVVDEKAWQGIVGDMCAVCNAEFENERDHLAGSLHALNLVKNEVEFNDEHIYRMIDNTTFQCITCNTVLPLSDLATHFYDPEHSLFLKRINGFKLDDLKKQSLKDSGTKDKPKLTSVYDISSTSSGSEGFNSAEGSSDESIPSQAGIDLEIPNKESNKSKILDSVTAFEKNEVNINFESETALCKKCLGNVDFDFKSIESHIKEHLRNPKKRDVGYVPFPCEADMKMHEPKSNKKPQLPAIAPPTNRNAVAKKTSCFDKNHNEIPSKPEKTEAKTKDNEPLNENPAEFAKQNKLTYNSWNNNAYCRLCLVRVPASLRSMKEHVSGAAHTTKLGQTSSSTSTSSSSFTYTHANPIHNKMPLEDYLDEVLSIENLFFGIVKVVNNKFCIGGTSFHLITVNGDRLRCQVCELFISRFEMSSHVELYSHKRHFNMVPVIMSFSTEFVREVRPGIFHCGFCNMMEASLEALKVHFESTEHKAKKEAAAASLSRHRPAIEEYRHRRIQAQLFAALRSGLFRSF